MTVFVENASSFAEIAIKKKKSEQREGERGRDRERERGSRGIYTGVTEE